ncbi:uncharacterized protein FA14DRAFT_22659 [Meira miltonrushii]|uniref:Wings apart-like protein C-terminal domain-containing protein n=1 Tax=Meira miltonrushii TaxID=1280837 RepID=A0A316VKI8_9BASI|nr:uncharacterized protein FA14DRAFT_22659 [Meira miltonrushii]PWN38066.1 hypothetical protein FA14DRAFT_22659 [Meira miltonrushii]
MMVPGEGTSDKRQRPQKRVFGNRGGKIRPQRKEDSKKEHTSHEPVSPKQDRIINSPSSRTISSPAKRSSTSASPSTPKKRTSHFSTPSSSPYSDLDLSKDVFERLSPKKAKLNRMSKSPADARRAYRSQLLLADDDEDDGQAEDGLKSGPLENNFVARPSRLAYASRMAPKKAKEPVEPSSPCSDLDKETGAWKSGKDSQETEAGEERGRIVPINKTLMQDVFDTESLSSKSLERWSQKTEEMDVASIPTTFQTDWKNLEEMDEEVEGSNDIRSIVNLRTAGTNLRSAAEIDDILCGLAIKNRVGARKATCIELIKLLMDAPQDGEFPVDWKPTPASSSTFITTVRRTSTTANLLSALQKAGAGEGKDATFDVSIGLAFTRLFEGKSLDEVMTILPSFLSTVKEILSASYHLPLKRDKHHDLLQKLASTLQTFRLSEEILKPDRVILQALVMMLSVQPKNAEEVQAPTPSPSFAGDLQSLEKALWDRLFEWSAAITFEGEDADVHKLASKCLSIRQACVLLRLLGVRYRDISSMNSKQLGELVQLNDHLGNQIGCQDDDLSHASAEALQACLQFQVSLTNQDQSENCKAMLSVSDVAALHLANIIVKSADVANDMDRDDVHNIRLLDLAALALGILTDLLQNEANQTIRQLSDCDAVTKMTTLFLYTSQQTDNQHSTLFAGCLAFFLSLLIVKAEDAEEDLISHAICEKMNNATPKEFCIKHKLAESLDGFACSAKEEQIPSEAGEQHSAHKQETLLIRELSDRLRRSKEQATPSE